MAQSEELKQNKYKLIKSLALVGLPEGLTVKQRHAQYKGVLPVAYNVHHLIPRSLGGSDDVDNLSVMRKDKHKMVHEHMKDLHGKVSKKELVDFAVDCGALTFEHAKAGVREYHHPIFLTNTRSRVGKMEYNI